MKTYKFEYDLTMSRQPQQGNVQFTEDGTITVNPPDEPSFTINAIHLEEVLVKAGVGCGLLYVKQKSGGDKILCRFTMTCLKKAGDFCKVVNYFIATGTPIIPEDKEHR
ncbi:MAG: hypothetical protein FWG64_06750, partial [Firmicutes bacterium]|nr:hypothetical protein [Bacillota bacterium]